MSSASESDGRVGKSSLGKFLKSYGNGKFVASASKDTRVAFTCGKTLVAGS